MAYEIGWFSTGRDEAARDLLQAVYERIEDGTIKAEMAFVFSNRERGEDRESDRFFDLVDGYGIDLVCFSSRRFKPQMRRRGLEETRQMGKDSELLRRWRREYDREIMKRLEGYNPDLNVLAGYMLITGDQICRRYRMINLHPAAPGGPKGAWQEVIWQLIGSGAEATGVMIHLVTEALDEGPPITYCTFPIKEGHFQPLWEDLARKLRERPLSRIEEEEGESNPLFREIRRQGVIRELPLLIHTIRTFTEGRIKIAGERVSVDGRPCDRGYDMTAEIDEQISR
ncbi:MAG TPA: phosphoglycerate transporter [Candidatus Latescibacteria bacterium]|nr:phosphoglycerate transporter [Candidatus Latescibacterota bacterium]